MNSLVQDPRTDDLYAGTAAGLFESQDGGVSWAAVTSFPETYRVRALAVNARLRALYLASAELRIQESFDGGMTWALVGSGLTGIPVSELTVSPDGSILYASTSAGVYTFEFHLPRLVLPRRPL